MIRTSHAVLAALVAAALASVPAAAGMVRAGPLTIEQPWTRATPNGAAIAAGYVSVANAGPDADTLTGGSLEGATGFQLHTMTMTGSVMTMRPSGPLTIPPGGRLVLSPAGAHVMITGLSRPLVKGEGRKGTLVFAHAGSVPVTFAVEAIGARGPDHGAMPGMAMP